MPVTAHIINHTHWDREWFITSVYTREWVRELIEGVNKVAQRNPKYTFLFDAQTLPLEDLLQINPELETDVRQLIARGNLIIGPYYCQPDWKLTDGETLIRNFELGRKDMAFWGAAQQPGWMVDTFGHISQGPQLHRLFGIDAVYLWRGVPNLEPFFTWRGSDGSELLTISVIAGYRNLYGVERFPEIAQTRLLSEVAKMAPYYPLGLQPHFDGYDLDTLPEDPVAFFAKSAEVLAEQDITLYNSSIKDYVDAVRASQPELDTVTSELNTGKYASVFVGTLSSRVYLKLLQHDLERLLYLNAEPLATLAWLKGRRYPYQLFESASRSLLQGSVHDCICGVSIETVHEKTEYLYRKLHHQLTHEMSEAAAYLLTEFKPGWYSITSHPFPVDTWQRSGDELFHLSTGGVGVSSISEAVPIKHVSEAIMAPVVWQNDYYLTEVTAKGEVKLAGAVIDGFVLRDELGDTYNEEIGESEIFLPAHEPVRIVERTRHHLVLEYRVAGHLDKAQIAATVKVVLDQSPLIQLEVDLDSSGVEFSLSLRCHTARTESVVAGMPFDMVERGFEDRDFLPDELDADLKKILIAQRDVNLVNQFPFHDFVAVKGGADWLVLLAAGLRAYRSFADGTIELPLRRSVEWIDVKREFKNFKGDAGPKMYVYGARCERRVSHRLAVMVTSEIESTEFLKWLSHFRQPPLVIENQVSSGKETEWVVASEPLLISALRVNDSNQATIRGWNPTTQPINLSERYHDSLRQIDLNQIEPKQVVELELGFLAADHRGQPPAEIKMRIPEWRVGRSSSLPDPLIMDLIKQRVDELQNQISQIKHQMDGAYGKAWHELAHQSYILGRELLEHRLVLRLAELRLKDETEITHDYLFNLDPETMELATQLREVRLKRRIYDHLIEAL